MDQADYRQKNRIVRIFSFYLEGFRSMTVGRTLWKVIIIKLIIMFGVIKLLFFPDFLQSNFSSDQQRADFVFSQITVQAEKQIHEIRR